MLSVADVTSSEFKISTTWYFDNIMTTIMNIKPNGYHYRDRVVYPLVEHIHKQLTLNTNNTFHSNDPNTFHNNFINPLRMYLDYEMFSSYHCKDFTKHLGDSIKNIDIISNNAQQYIKENLELLLRRYQLPINPYPMSEIIKLNMYNLTLFTHPKWSEDDKDLQIIPLFNIMTNNRMQYKRGCVDTSTCIMYMYNNFNPDDTNMMKAATDLIEILYPIYLSCRDYDEPLYDIIDKK